MAGGRLYSRIHGAADQKELAQPTETTMKTTTTKREDAADLTS